MGKSGGIDHSDLFKGNGEMRIGINATFLNEKPTGVGILTREVSRIISLHKEMLMFTPVDQDDLPSGSVIKAPGGMKGSARLSNSLYRFAYINTILPVLCRLRGVNVLYCPILEFPFTPLTPLVVHLHDLHFVHFASDFGLAAPRMKFSLKLLGRIATRVIVSSEFVKKEVVAATNVGEAMIDVVPLAYSDSLFTTMPGEGKRAFFDKYRLKANYLLFVGTLFPYKNLKTLTDAFLRIKSQIPHSLVIVGRKQFSAGSLASDERIVYVDYVPAEDLPLFYSYADMFIYPSLSEGFGIPPLEAMACGAPVISSNGGSLPEVVGDAGLLFDPEDSGALGTLILKVVNDEKLRKDLIAKGFRNVKKFSWQRTAEGIIKSCERAAEEKG